MAYTKKTWEDFPNASTPITAEDLNNIEDAIEALDTDKAPIERYVTGEIKPTSKFIDGKQVFVKKINVGVLPNNERKLVATGLSNITIVRLEGIALNALYGVYITLPYNYGGTEVITISYLAGNLRVDSNSNSTQYTGWVNIFFTYN